MSQSAAGPVFDLAAEVLAAFVDAYAGSALKVPDRQFVSPGDVAVDCEQLVVEIERLRTGLPGVPSFARVDATTVFTVELAVHVDRPLPSIDDQGSAPSAAAESTHAGAVLLEVWQMASLVVQGLQAGSFLAGACERVTLVDVIPKAQLGGYGGAVAHLHVLLA